MTSNSLFFDIIWLFWMYFYFIFILVIRMKVKVFDEENEKDLEEAVNSFMDDGEIKVKDVKYQVAISVCGEEQIYCFSAMIIYEE